MVGSSGYTTRRPGGCASRLFSVPLRFPLVRHGAPVTVGLARLRRIARTFVEGESATRHCSTDSRREAPPTDRGRQAGPFAHSSRLRTRKRVVTEEPNVNSPWRKSSCIRRAMPPAWLRCSSLKYSRYSRSSRPASRAPHPPRCDAGLPPRAVKRNRRCCRCNGRRMRRPTVSAESRETARCRRAPAVRGEIRDTLARAQAPRLPPRRG
jgi:hypothetical protein